MFTLPDIIILVIIILSNLMLLLILKNKKSDSINKTLSDNKGEIIEKNLEYQQKINKDINDFKQSVKDDLFSLNNNIYRSITELNDKVNNSLKGGFKETNTTFNEIKEKVTKIDMAQKNIETLSKEVVSLQNVLTNNQARGQFGEYQLNNLLMSLYGENNKLYALQYTFNNCRADAVIFMQEPINMICIDSKFPYSSFSKLLEEKMDKELEIEYLNKLKQDIKKHIKAISEKYIISNVTAPFAWMFIPSDALLSLIHYKMEDIIKYANSLNVSIVSPTLLLPLLTSYKVLNINLEQNKNALYIKEQLLKLEPDIKGLKERWETLYKQIEAIDNSSDLVNIKVNKIVKKFNDLKNNEE